MTRDPGARPSVPHHHAPERIRREFDRQAPRYEAGRLATWHQAQAELVLAHLERPGRCVAPLLLDVGCGTGWLLRRWASRGATRQGLGVDLSPAMVERARRLTDAEGVGGLRFVAGDWDERRTVEAVRARLPTLAGAVTCVSAFHYLADPAAALRRMVRLVAPGGTLILLDRAVDQAPLTLVWDFVHRAVMADQARFFRTDGLRALMEGAGLQEVHVIKRIQRLFWKGRLETSLVLLAGQRPREGDPTGDPPSITPREASASPLEVVRGG